MDKNNYFSDDCIVEDEFYRNLKILLFCPLCNKLFKDPMLCSVCGKTYCQKCIENICPNNCKNNTFAKDINKNVLLSKLKYKCKNCSEEIIQSEITAHLESDCQYKEDDSNSKSLSEIYQTKKTLTRLSEEEMRKYDINEVNCFTSKL